MSRCRVCALWRRGCLWPNDCTADNEPERIGHLFSEVFDLIDKTVDGIPDAEVDDALRQVKHV